jgi:hypothetical protein
LDNSFFHRLSIVVQEVWDALVKKPVSGARISDQKSSPDIPAKLVTDLLPPTSGGHSSDLPEPGAYYSGATDPKPTPEVHQASIAGPPDKATLDRVASLLAMLPTETDAQKKAREES